MQNVFYVTSYYNSLLLQFKHDEQKGYVCMSFLKISFNISVKRFENLMN